MRLSRSIGPRWVSVVRLRAKPAKKNQTPPLPLPGTGVAPTPDSFGRGPILGGEGGQICPPRLVSS